MCGESDIRCLDFHHRDPATKLSGINKMIRDNYSMEVVEAEIAKCDVICANCHRKLDRIYDLCTEKSTGGTKNEGR